jgi:hypothetical protein
MVTLISCCEESSHTALALKLVLEAPVIGLLMLIPLSATGPMNRVIASSWRRTRPGARLLIRVCLTTTLVDRVTAPVPDVVELCVSDVRW